jgi:hypothetical protein
MNKIRFWEWQNGAVKITIRKDQCLRHHKTYFNGEGWTHSYVEYVYDGRTLRRYAVQTSRDCDGPSSYTCESYCDLSELKHISDDDVLYPNWKFGTEQNFDAYAAIMNY